MSDITYPTKNTGDQSTAAEANEIKTAVNTKVDKVGGKGLSTNDYTTGDKNKVANVPADTNAELAAKVDVDGVKQLSDENYTSAEKSKLAGLANYFKGSYTTLVALEAAHPTGQPGWEALVDEVGGIALKYIWDDTDSTWVQSSGMATATFAEIGGSPSENAALNDAFGAKVDKVSGKALSTNDFDATAKGKVDNLPGDTNAALTAKANDADVVKLTGSQTIAGAKEFTTGLKAFREGAIVTSTSYIFVIGDRGLFIEANNAAAQTFTIPPNADVAFAIDTEIEICRIGAGEVSIAQGSGVTIQSAGNRLRITEQYGAVVIKKRATNTWRLIGGTKI